MHSYVYGSIEKYLFSLIFTISSKKYPGYTILVNFLSLLSRSGINSKYSCKFGRQKDTRKIFLSSSSDSRMLTETDSTGAVGGSGDRPHLPAESWLIYYCAHCWNYKQVNGGPSWRAIVFILTSVRLLTLLFSL